MFRMTTSELPCEISFLGNSDIWYHAAEQKSVQFHTNLIQLKCNPKFYCETYTCIYYVSDKFMKKLFKAEYMYIVYL